MARVYPEPLPTYVRENPLRSAECRVYDQLSKGLRGDYTVFYSRPWLGLTADGREVDGEADFVIAHPDSGVLVLEVKGGVVSRDAATEGWQSRDRHGRIHRIKNPVDQARTSKYRILQKLKELSFWDDRYIKIRHGVILPDSANPRSDLGPDMPLELFAFGEDMDSLGRWVEERLGDHDCRGDGAGPFSPLGDSGVRALTHLLARDFQLRTSLAGALAAEDHRIQVLTEQQYHILEYLKRAPRCAVEGGAGSGKTVLAAEYAIRLAEAGQRTLLTCYNRPLADHLAAVLGSKQGLVIKSFHQFCGWILRGAGVKPPDFRHVGDDGLFLSGLSERVVQIMDEGAGQRFDAVLVDEAQDFRSDWLTALALCLEDPDKGRFHLFFDNNQRVYAADGPLGRTETPPFPLSRNLRNSRQIFQLAQEFYLGPAYMSAGPEGREVAMVPVEQTEFDDEVAKQLGRLIRTEGVSPGAIAVLAAGRRLIGEGLRERLAGHYQLRDAGGVDSDDLVLDTIQRFKGLERRVVVLLTSERLLDDPELAYVGFSRARLYLVILGPSSVLDALPKGP